MWTVRSAMNRCTRFIAPYLPPSFVVLASIAQTTDRATRALSGGFTDMLGRYAKLHLFFSLLCKANSPKANRASRLNGARSVAAFVSLYMGINHGT